MDFAERWSDKRQQVEVANFQQRLSELGAEGWEMVSYESVWSRVLAEAARLRDCASRTSHASTSMAPRNRRRLEWPAPSRRVWAAASCSQSSSIGSRSDTSARPASSTVPATAPTIMSDESVHRQRDRVPAWAAAWPACNGRLRRLTARGPGWLSARRRGGVDRGRRSCVEPVEEVAGPAGQPGRGFRRRRSGERESLDNPRAGGPRPRRAP